MVSQDSQRIASLREKTLGICGPNLKTELLNMFVLSEARSYVLRIIAVFVGLVL